MSTRNLDPMLAPASVAVVGVPDELWGERVCAVVVWRDAPVEAPAQEQALIDWTENRMAGFKRPRSVVSVDEIPLNASGKVDKPALRARLT